jgi:murein endopeptidase
MKLCLLFLMIAPALVVWTGTAPGKERSLSLKNASDGYLLHGKRLRKRGRYHRVLSRTVRNDFRWGTDELTYLLRRSARRVAKKYPGSILLVGNLSKKGGGDLPGSVSHNSGRDADLPFYAVDAKGRFITSHKFARFDASGRSGRYRFDIRRNWALVRALLSYRRIQVQWIFVADRLKRKLIRHAKQSGAPQWIIARASKVLGQPGNSSAHAEHFHVRVYCNKHERLEGCLNYGPTWAWVDDYAEEIAKRTSELLVTVENQSLGTEKPVQAVRKIAAIRGHSGVLRLVKVLSDPREPVRAAVVDALVVLDGIAEATESLLQAYRRSRSAEWSHKLIKCLALRADERAAGVLVSALLPGSKLKPKSRALAAGGLGRLLHSPSILKLAEALKSRSSEIRIAASLALERITNRDFGLGNNAIRRWMSWWKKNKARTRMDWVRDGFASRFKIRVPKKRRRKSITKLVNLIRRGGPVSFNARALIYDETGFQRKQGHFTDRQMFRFYRSWLRSGGYRSHRSPKSDGKPAKP